ncbi:1-acyl-sn-glycerol-3-phosphate acyltransferase [Streptosporangium becharense]|uniref:1-acyl-sn-glycerol-3-phosphate acyltransferase n=1 Tax=Streptosporangium becharense TaxID=1816182 RepID=A0A7W9IJL2_9ACTN|nr:1-acyl-sn-glycerol-3-phosphate acyltransferase [Streptosporangium becharense]MBB2910998.1 1-acyl-sn-glycerol-3-phosphate acyltransferase [Streptosporangium becharense]MBB5821944.1 1-acyl-sn-glycerol-3-phosphate acyltransferase [Streptosporangium becharense]
MLPPRIVRRLVLAPLLVVLTVVALVTLPIWLLVVTAASLRLPPPQRRGTRLVWFAVAWLTLESMALAACLGLWVACGFGGRLHRDEHQERHYALIRWFLSRVYDAAVRIFQLSIEIDEPPPGPGESSRRLTRPVIVLSRHAGPGDSVLLVHHLLTRYDRRPRILMKAAMQFDPSLDVVVNRLPNAFVPNGAAESGVLTEIRRLASGMDADDALVIFPEGGNFTPKRRLRAILRLEDKGLTEDAARARRMENLMAPRPNGALAAIDACPEADVIFVAHTGLDDLVTLGDIWRKLPMRAEIKAKWWRVRAADVPRDRDDQIRWLFDQWERIDAWVAENRPTPAPTP